MGFPQCFPLRSTKHVLGGLSKGCLNAIPQSKRDLIGNLLGRGPHKGTTLQFYRMLIDRGGHLTRVPVECNSIEPIFWRLQQKQYRHSISCPRHSNFIIFYKNFCFSVKVYILHTYTPEITRATSIKLNTAYSLKNCFGLFEIARGSQ